MFSIVYTDQAVDDLRWFKRHEQVTIVDGIEQQLCYEPITETRNRKRLRSNAVADWELRLGNFRVLYRVDNDVEIVEIQRVGEKRRNAFFFRGRKEDL
jgi:mRNA-degrading endonuclease RelE of RelBE toxin-antitoxin system